jgi:hypothetical protein
MTCFIFSLFSIITFKNVYTILITIIITIRAISITIILILAFDTCLLFIYIIQEKKIGIFNSTNFNL